MFGYVPQMGSRRFTTRKVWRKVWRIVWPGLAYGTAAAFSIGLTRAGDGIAMFWIATALLVPVLVARPARSWWPTLAACWIANALVTATIGVGWQLAPVLSTVNLAEAAVIALLLRAAHRRFASTSPQWLGLAFVVGGLIAPLLSGTVASALVGWQTGRPAVAILGGWMLSHGLGFVCLFPTTALLAQARARHRRILPEPGKRLAAGALLAAVIAAGALCFGQSAVPLLFLPILVLMYTMVLTDLMVSAVAMAVLVAMGIGSASLGIGPLRVMAAAPADRFLFLQFYIVCVSLAAIPIALLLEKRRAMFAALAESEARYRLLADFSTDIIMVTGAGGEIRYISPSIRQLGDYEPDQLIGQDANLLIVPQHQAAIAEAHRRVLKNPGATASVEFLGMTRADGPRWFESHLRGVFREDGAPDGVCSIVRDISKRKRRESELRAVALTDPLTSLANRRAFDMFMGTFSANNGGKDDGESYVAMFDLDHFKRVNDGFGHATGDVVIKAFARAARGVLRDSDLVARIGGEEFAVHLNDTTLPQAQLVCERIRAAFAHEARLAAPQVGPVSASVGIGRYDGALDAVLRRADAALYQAKANGRDCLAIAA